MANADIANQTDVIILNRMYVGGYLGENIGHEVINLMKPDEGDDYYIYINARGDLREEFITKEWRAKTILLTRWCTYEYKDEGNNNTKKLIPITNIKNEYLYTIFAIFVETEQSFGKILTIKSAKPKRQVKIKLFFILVSFFKIVVENFNVILK